LTDSFLKLFGVRVVLVGVRVVGFVFVVKVGGLMLVGVNV